ncbi:hypothetical protein AB6A40_011571, partial [Gnathostoma spinigerum]
ISGIFIVGAKRTAFGTFGGSLKNKTATDLAEIAGRAALEHAKVKPELIDHVIFGNVIQSSKDSIYLSRHAGLRIGVPIHVPALTVNRLCGSGFQAIVNAAEQIILGESSLVLAGGSENMSQTPFAVRNIRFGTSLATPYEFEDVLWAGLTDSYANMAMGMTAEKLGAQYKITREEADAFAVRSQTLWRKGDHLTYFILFCEPSVVISVETKSLHICKNAPCTNVSGVVFLSYASDIFFN